MLSSELKYTALIGFTDAYVGTWIRVQKRTRLSQRNAASGNAEAAMLLLCPGLQEQHQPPTSETTQRLPNSPNSLQAQARHEALQLQEMWEDFRRQRGLENAREELRQAVVLHLRIGFQAQEITKRSHQIVRKGAFSTPVSRRIRSR